MQGQSLSGVIPVDKPQGISSAAVVGIIKRAIFNQYGVKVKVGHTGTLDPMASGVLPVCIGKATRLFDMLSDKIKGYRAEFVFGKTTDTLDITGNIIDCDCALPTLSAVKEGILNNIGDIMQLPPKFSAKSIGGVKAYQLMRKGCDVELKSVCVHIRDIRIAAVNGVSDYSHIVADSDKCQSILLDIDCGGGTYIRSLGRDIAQSAGTCACMSSLIRTYSGHISLSQCSPLEELKVDVLQGMIPTIDIVSRFMPIYDLPYSLRHKFLNGVSVQFDVDAERFGITVDGQIYCIAIRGESGIKAVTNLWE
ncbi:MAG: tRNA pseudouridine(55) synthase TruB [Clostridia bacterium]|nr:tRNA pseudouridine(55) synthase TruB [Clostridia bacterium]